MNTVFLLLAQYEQPRLTLEQLAEMMDITFETARNQIYAGRFPIPTYKDGGKTFADIRDVAKHLDEQREAAAERYRLLQEKLSA